MTEINIDPFLDELNRLLTIERPSVWLNTNSVHRDRLWFYVIRVLPQPTSTVEATIHIANNRAIILDRFDKELKKIEEESMQLIESFGNPKTRKNKGKAFKNTSENKMPTLASTKKKNTKDKGQRKEAPKAQRQQPQEALTPNVEFLEEQTKTENESQKEGPGDLEEYSSEQTFNPIDRTHGAVQGGVVEEELVSVSKGSGINAQVMFFIEKLQKENAVFRNKLEEQNVRLEEQNKELKEQNKELKDQNKELKEQNVRLEEQNKELKDQKADLEEQNSNMKNRISVLERDMKRMSLEMDMMKRSFDTVLSLDTEEQLSNSIANCCVRNCPLKLRYGI